MKTPHRIAALAAAAVVPVALVAPAAHADSTYTGALTSSDPAANFLEPDPATDKCVKASPGNQLANYDAVTFTSKTTGPRRIVVRNTSATPTPFAIWAYRNGTCVTADYMPDDETEAAQGIVDLDNVVFAKGDAVTIRFISLAPPAGTGVPWRLDILQPGTANAAAVGRGASYVTLPEQVGCGNHKATVKVTKKARKAKSIVFKAGGKKVGEVKRVRPGKSVKLKGIPVTATSIKAVVKLKGGGKAKVVRAYSACR